MKLSHNSSTGLFSIEELTQNQLYTLSAASVFLTCKGCPVTSELLTVTIFSTSKESAHKELLSLNKCENIIELTILVKNLLKKEPECFTLGTVA